MSKRLEDLFDTGKAIATKHPGGRPREHEEPRTKLSVWIARSKFRALEEIKNAERDRKARANAKDWQSITLTSIVVQAIDEYIARRRRK